MSSIGNGSRETTGDCGWSSVYKIWCLRFSHQVLLLLLHGLRIMKLKSVKLPRKVNAVPHSQVPRLRVRLGAFPVHLPKINWLCLIRDEPLRLSREIR